jgi:endonuclease/exonuclease/phosphatase family metal-dependent hydrolase
MRSFSTKPLAFFIIFFVACSVSGQSQHFMTYNIKYDNKSDSINNWELRKAKMVDLIIHYSPDFLGIQEGLGHQVHFLDHELQDYSFIGVGRDDGIEKGEFSAIFYKEGLYGLVDSGTFWLSDTPDKPSVGWDAAMERICTYGLFRDRRTDELLWVFNTHFDHIGLKARAASADLILHKISALNTRNHPVVLMGDLNLTPDTRPIKRISSTLYDAQSVAEKVYGPTGTFNGFTNDSIVVRIDYVFVSGFKVYSYEHIDDRLNSGLQISDHLPVFVKAVFE